MGTAAPDGLDLIVVEGVVRNFMHHVGESAALADVEVEAAAEVFEGWGVLHGADSLQALLYGCGVDRVGVLRLAELVAVGSGVELAEVQFVYGFILFAGGLVELNVQFVVVKI